VPSFHEIRRALDAHQPRRLAMEESRQAGVAMVLRGDDRAPEVLLIERAKHPCDPWSGHMAFPGGRRDPQDRHARAAAERETCEEVGLSLLGATLLGRLDDLEGHHAGRPAGLIISAFVYYVADPTPLVPNQEVAEAFWVPLRVLHDPARHVGYVYGAPGGPRFPGVRVGQAEGHIVWGLTYRFLESFFRVVGCPFPDARLR
jgi:8-oxo-dGTP pyrophosphatase MutT (NUDIX family)